MRARVFDDDDSDSEDPRMANSRRKFLNKEVDALERTLAKRRSQLQDADRLLKECNYDLREAREQVCVIHTQSTAYRFIIAVQSVAKGIK